jgi:hypothetical protein
MIESAQVGSLMAGREGDRRQKLKCMEKFRPHLAYGPRLFTFGGDPCSCEWRAHAGRERAIPAGRARLV